jgi:hypothetical protein
MEGISLSNLSGTSQMESESNDHSHNSDYNYGYGDTEKQIEITVFIFSIDTDLDTNDTDFAEINSSSRSTCIEEQPIRALHWHNNNSTNETKIAYGRRHRRRHYIEHRSHAKEASESE